MSTDQILYTDGQHVVVTPHTFQVDNTFYKLAGITKHGLGVVRGAKLPGILITLAGLLLAAVGILKQVPVTIENPVWFGIVFKANTLALAGGVAIAITGLIVIASVGEKYTVRIATAEGEKNAVISTHREYISQILNALNRAFMMMHTPKRTK